MVGWEHEGRERHASLEASAARVVAACLAEQTTTPSVDIWVEEQDVVLGVDVAVGGSRGGHVGLVHLRLQEGAGGARSDLRCARRGSEARLPALIGQPLPQILHVQPRSVLAIQIGVGVHADNELAVRVPLF